MSHKEHLPPISLESVNDYLCLFDNILKEDKMEKLYESRFLKTFRAAQEDDYFYIKGVCRAEMKKHTTYTIDIKLNPEGSVDACNCECPAGLGPNAHCKHVRTVLNAALDYINKGEVLLELTCTQRLQTFHKATEYFGSPVKISNLPRKRRMLADSSTKMLVVEFDPRPKKFRNQEGYNDYVRNLAINYSASGVLSGKRLTILQLYPMANVIGMEHDHDYLPAVMSDCYLNSLGVTSISAERAALLEKATRKQSEDKTWIQERCFRLHYSNFGRICKAQNKDKAAEELVKVRKLKGAALQHGKNCEAKAVKKYKELTGNSVTASGIIVSLSHPYLACSPDGLVGKDKVVEVKCPYTARNRKITPVSVPYLYMNNDNKYQLKNTHDYYYQVQGLLLITGRSVCDFVVFTFADCVINVKRDHSFLSSMEQQLSNFFVQHFKKALLSRYFYRLQNGNSTA